MIRKNSFENDCVYHIYNRGVDKRAIFLDKFDYERFLQGMREFNSVDPIGSIYENSFLKDKPKRKEKPLVSFVAYCINPNHFHFILEQVSPKGIEKFMQRLGMGYAKYFNNKNKRSGTLFQGKFKAKHIDSNEYLLHLSVYVNLNFKVHKLGHSVSKSSWGKYKNGKFENNVSINDRAVLDQFDNFDDYKKFAESSLTDILERKEMYKKLEEVLIDD